MACTSSAPSTNAQSQENNEGEETVNQEYKLVWSDEFDDDEIDSDTWNFWTGPAYNNELQYYTSRPENVFVEDGFLHLTAHNEPMNGHEYTSARISTDSTKIGWKEGRFEARIKMPAGKGFWPAFWLMPIRDIGWPRGGEIDIMEFRGNEPNSASGAIHYWREGCEGNPVECRKYNTESFTFENQNLSEDFHIYALEWTNNQMTWYVDDNEFMQISLKQLNTQYNPFSSFFYIILNLAVGGDFLPNPDETTEFSQSLVVDYVKVYQK